MILPALREAIVDDYSKTVNGFPDGIKIDVRIGAGATHVMESIFNYCKKLMKQEIMMLGPIYSTYLTTAEQMGCRVNIIKAPKDGVITPEHIESAIKKHPNTKYILLTFPVNPTGQIFTDQELIEIAKLVIKYDLIMIADEVFINLGYNSSYQITSFASITVNGISMLERTLTLRSVSKDRGLAALRLGWIVGPSELIDKIKSSLFVYGTIFAVDDFSQHISSQILREASPRYFEEQSRFLVSNVNLLQGLLENINKQLGFSAFRLQVPDGGMFSLISAYGLKDRKIAGNIIESDTQLCKIFSEFGVGLLPASMFGMDPLELKLRITLTSSQEEIELGMNKLLEGLRYSFVV